ncbi:response regulator transcription factor [Thermus sp. FJN-A]
MRILLVEDEPDIGEPLTLFLAKEGYEVGWARSVGEAWGAFLETEPDLLVLDVMLPEGVDAGFRFADAVREGGYAGGILFLTARDGLEDRVYGLDLGGDDYLVKPFAFGELLARVRALLRRGAQHKARWFRRGPLEVDLVGKRAFWQGKEAILSPTEFHLLEVFCLYPHRLFGTEELADRLFPGRESSLRLVRVYVHRLRNKLGPEVVRTGAGGYGLGLSD